MYNLLVGRIDGALPANRMLEHTDSFVRSYVAPQGAPVDTAKIANLPVLLMPEFQDRQSPQVARVGDIHNLVFTGSEYRFRFAPNPAVPAIGCDRIAKASASLHINTPFEFNRTHWAVKDVDLYRTLHESVLGSILAPQVFKLPTEARIGQDLVAVMMPFDARFNPVYSTLQQAAAGRGMRCNRADDIWEQDNVMDDVISLIWRARIVIADMTSRNPNVFYEAGIAHTLGRDVIQITQSMSEIPFDLQSIRSVQYLPNGEGLEKMKNQVIERIRYLVSNSS